MIEETRKAFESLGIEIPKKQEAVINTNNKVVVTNEVQRPKIWNKRSTREAAVVAKLIPDAYKDAEFSSDRVKQNLADQAKGMRKHKFYRVDTYLQKLNELLTLIDSGVRPDRSYIIGAPNGLGKTSFAVTAILKMYERGWKVVPYVSLYELAEIKAETDKRLLKGFRTVGYADRKDMHDKEIPEDSSDLYEMSYYTKIEDDNYVKNPEIITGCYSWSEYMNADVLITFLASLDFKEVESKILKAILDIRSAKGLPTIVFASTSLNIYKNDARLREYVWDEILSYREDIKCFDRLLHVSCFKTYNARIDGGESNG